MEEPQHHRRPRAIADGHAQRGPVAEAPRHRLHHPFHLAGLAGLEFADRHDAGAVLVLARQLHPQVLHRQQAARGQLFSGARADPGQSGQRL